MTEKQEHRPTGAAENGGDRAGGLGGDSGGLSLAICTSAGGASKNDAAGSLDREGGESVGRKDCVGGNEKPAFVQREIDIPAEAKMRMVPWATRSTMRESTKRPEPKVSTACN